MAPDNSLPSADVPPRRSGWQNTPGWVAGLALALVVLCIVLRTGIATRDGASKDESDSIEQNFTAVQTTKTAYVMSRSGALDETPGKVSHSFSSHTSFADKAIEKWREITASPSAHTGDWRRYALTLSLFHRQGVTEALSHIAAARAVDKARLDKEKSRSARSRRAQAAEVPVAEEVALWKTLYAATPIPGEHVETLRTVIRRLNLGWFEHAAMAQLDTRIGQKAQAARELEAASRSAALLMGFQSIQVCLLMLGAVGLLTVGLMFVLNRFSSKPSIAPYEPSYVPAVASGVAPTHLYPSSFSPAIPGAFPPPPLLPTIPPLPPRFSYRARTVAFSIYMAVFMIIGLPLRLVRPFVEDWSAGTITRLNTIFEIVAYVPVVFIALWALRHLAAAESPTRTLPTWRETFRTLGLTSERPLADIGIGTLNYIVLMPLFYAVTGFSQYLFRHYHTPINPVQFDSMIAQNGWDRLLLLFITAVAAPVVEELMFRGLLYPALKTSWGKVGGAALSGAVFALVHPTLPSGFLPIMLLGFAFALTYERRGSLLANIVMHGIHNGLILLTVFFLFAR